jgi:pyruvate, water dikinase
MFRFFDFFRKRGLKAASDEHSIQHTYRSFTSLLRGNNHALELMTELESLLYEGRQFSIDGVVAQTEQLIGTVYDIVEDLNAMSGGKYGELFEATERIGVSVLRDLVRKRKFAARHLLLPLERLSHENVDEVGGKAANLGEIFNRANLPVPKGFALTAYACHHFLKENGLQEFISARMRGLDIADTERLMDIGQQIQERILTARLPLDFERAIAREAEEMCREFGAGLKFSVRSSATCEDSEATFAGQHATVLNVLPANIGQAYKEVVASTFNPRAIFYRRSKGYSDEDVIMCVLCVMMVDARASGVMYTVDPNHADVDDVLVSAVWGLGLSLVDGSAKSDFFQIAKQGRTILRREIPAKARRLVMTDTEGLREEVVGEEEAAQPCLTDDQVDQLVRYGLHLETHYGTPLDIEWAIDKAGRLMLLQARPLNRTEKVETRPKRSEGPLPGASALLHGGQTASPGTASGLAFLLRSDHALHHIPKGAILVAAQTSPAYVPIMGHIQGIVTDIGSVTGHMASVAREFGIPTLVGTGDATTLIEHGQEITLDATNRFVYSGRVQELLTERKPVNLMKGSPVYKLVQEAMKKIAPLNLIDPRKEGFSPEGCRTLHDIIRFAHEMAMQEMFRIGDAFAGEEAVAARLKVSLPLSIYVIDLGGGIDDASGSKTVDVGQVRSVPFMALLGGMTHPEVEWQGGIDVSVAGFACILAESVLRDPHLEGRMGGPNYAVVSKEYLNFNARLGYHFATLDTYCGPQVNDNYVLFSFKGGAADIGRRSRRARLISMILKRLGFRVENRGDLVRGEIKKYSQQLTCEKLDALGRMLGSVRLLDMVLSDDGQLEWYVEEFFRGNYAYRKK